MILAILGLGGVGLWFLVAGDGPAKLVGVLLIALAALFAFLLWVALEVERPGSSGLAPAPAEIRHG